MKIMKFGGSSVRSAERIARVASLVDQSAGSERIAVVSSALGGVTDQLVALGNTALGDEAEALATVAEIEKRHLDAARELARSSERESLEHRLAERFEELRDVVHGVALLGECSPRTNDLILSFGERLAVELVAAALRALDRDAQAVNTRTLVRTDSAHGRARVRFDDTYEAVREHFDSCGDPVQVLTGFVGGDERGQTTTIGRGGSDYTAALVGAALGARVIEIWTDVDGVLSADPRLVPEAHSIPSLSFEELLELSHFGAKVVYPPTIQPARRARVPLVIRNTLNPEFPGTVIDETSSRPDPQHPVTGVTSICDVTLLRIEGAGMLGVPGTAKRLFGALARHDISVILISQASSEHSICFAVEPGSVEIAKSAIDDEFAVEQSQGSLSDLVIEPGQCVLATVGEGMRERPGIAARLFQILGRRAINVRAIAQGSSELNISVVLDGDDEQRALRAIHDAMFRDEGETLRIVVAGVGGVGGTLLEQIEAVRDRLPHLEVCGVLDSKRQVLSEHHLDHPTRAGVADWKTWLEEHGEPNDPDELLAWLSEHTGARAFVDCTSSSALTRLYEPLLANGISVVAANKLAFSSSLADYRQIFAARRSAHRGLYYETTVGAGLPVLHTLRSLIESGDKVLKIEGLLSGTLSFVLDCLRQGEPLSQVVRKAFDEGFTEPDPREDLSGNDVGRKLLILARESGLDLEPADVAIEPLVRVGHSDATLDEFWNLLPSSDSAFAEKLNAAASRQTTLAYLATLDQEGARVALEDVPLDHPAATVRGTDNLIVVTSERYPDGLVIRGPGAGKDVTAAGVLADLIRAHSENSLRSSFALPEIARSTSPGGGSD